MKEKEILISLKRSNIKPGDCLMIHGDSAVSAQFMDIPIENRLSLLFETIIKYLGKEGTLVVPTFTYSATKNEIFDVIETKSEVGYFSEFFRRMSGVVRSEHPIFSVAAIGKYKENFSKSSLEDCFGKNTNFDILHNLNGKIMNLGCSFDFITYAHYVEQKLGVSYRYFKEFKADIKKGNSVFKKKTRYFVGNRSINYKLDLTRLKNELVIVNKIKIIPFGRFPCFTVSCKDFFSVSQAFMKKNKYFLIQEGNDY